MPFLPTPVRSWLRTRLAEHLARTMARALQGTEESCRIEAGLTPDAAPPDLPAAWPAHRRIALLATVEDVRRRHALWIRLAGADRMVFALDTSILPRLRLWTGPGQTGGWTSGSAFVTAPFRSCSREDVACACAASSRADASRPASPRPHRRSCRR